MAANLWMINVQIFGILGKIFKLCKNKPKKETIAHVELMLAKNNLQSSFDVLSFIWIFFDLFFGKDLLLLGKSIGISFSWVIRFTSVKELLSVSNSMFWCRLLCKNFPLLSIQMNSIHAERPGLRSMTLHPYINAYSA